MPWSSRAFAGSVWALRPDARFFPRGGQHLADEVGQALQHDRNGSGTGATCVFFAGHVPRVAHPVLDGPVLAGVRSRLHRTDLVGVQVGEGEAHLAAALFLAVPAAVTPDVHHLTRLEEGRPSGHDDLERAVFLPPMGVGGPLRMGQGHLPPRQSGRLLVRCGAVALDVDRIVGSTVFAFGRPSGGAGRVRLGWGCSGRPGPGG